MAGKFRTSSGYIEELDGKIQGNLSSIDGTLTGNITNLLGLKGTISPGSSPSGAGISVEVGTVTDGYPLSITNSGTTRHVILDFVIPTTINHLGQNEPVIFYCGSASEVV